MDDFTSIWWPLGHVVTSDQLTLYNDCLFPQLTCCLYFDPFRPVQDTTIICDLSFYLIASQFGIMGESFFRREFLNPRKFAFNVIWHGLHVFFFALGWYLQVIIFSCLVKEDWLFIVFLRLRTKNLRVWTHWAFQYGLLVVLDWFWPSTERWFWYPCYAIFFV